MPRLDVNQVAHRLIREATEGKTPESSSAKRGRKGGRAGGPARARKLTRKRRREIAQAAAKARWSRPRQKPSR